MKGGQRSVTGARALGLSMTAEGNTGILLLRGIEVVVVFVVFITVGVTLGEVLGGGGSGRGPGGRCGQRSEKAVAPRIGGGSEPRHAPLY
jgi:predicted metalloprotease